MTHATANASLLEDLTDLPAADAVRTILKRAVEAGIPEGDAIDDAFGAVVSRAVEIDGPEKTAARLLVVAKALTEMVRPTGVAAN